MAAEQSLKNQIVDLNQRPIRQVNEQRNYQEWSGGIPREHMMSKEMIFLRTKLYLLEKNQVNLNNWNPSDKEIHQMFNRDLDRAYEYKVLKDCIQQIRTEYRYGKFIRNISYYEYTKLLDEVNSLNIFEKFIMQNLIIDSKFKINS